MENVEFCDGYVLREGYGSVAWTRSLVKDTPKHCKLALGDWLSEYEWDWFVTQTFREEISFPAAARIARRQLLTLESLVKGPLGAFIALERHKYRGGEDPASLCPHIHILLRGVREAEDFGLRRRSIWRMFYEKYGRMRIEPYDPDRGATYYLGKYVAKEISETGEWDVWRPEAWKPRDMDLTAHMSRAIITGEVGK